MTDDTDLREAMRSVRGTWRVWVLLVASMLIGGWGLQQMYRERENALADLTKADVRATEKQAELTVADQERTTLKDQIKKLEEEAQALRPLKEKEEAAQKANEDRVKALEALKAAIEEKWKADAPRVTAAADGVTVEIVEKNFFDAPDAAAISKHGAESIAALGALTTEAKATTIHVVVHGESFPALNDKSKGAQATEALFVHLAAITRAIHDKTKGVDVELTMPIVKSDKKRVEMEIQIETPSPEQKPKTK